MFQGKHLLHDIRERRVRGLQDPGSRDLERSAFWGPGVPVFHLGHGGVHPRRAVQSDETGDT